jgi:hypothetical protein
LCPEKLSKLKQAIKSSAILYDALPSPNKWRHLLPFNSLNFMSVCWIEESECGSNVPDELQM